MFFTTKKEEICTSGCCTPAPKGKMECPKCRVETKEVLAKTLDALLTKEAKKKLNCLEGFYYCKTPNCEIAYFNGDTILGQDSLTVEVGLKDGVSPATLCYCFGWSKEKIEKEIKKRHHNSPRGYKSKNGKPRLQLQSVKPKLWMLFRRC